MTRPGHLHQIRSQQAGESAAEDTGRGRCHPAEPVQRDHGQSPAVQGRQGRAGPEIFRLGDRPEGPAAHQGFQLMGKAAFYAQRQIAYIPNTWRMGCTDLSFNPDNPPPSGCLSGLSLSCGTVNIQYACPDPVIVVVKIPFRGCLSTGKPRHGFHPRRIHQGDSIAACRGQRDLLRGIRHLAGVHRVHGRQSDFRCPAGFCARLLPVQGAKSRCGSSWIPCWPCPRCSWV